MRLKTCYNSRKPRSSLPSRRVDTQESCSGPFLFGAAMSRNKQGGLGDKHPAADCDSMTAGNSVFICTLAQNLCFFLKCVNQTNISTNDFLYRQSFSSVVFPFHFMANKSRCCLPTQDETRLKSGPKHRDLPLKLQ